MIQSNLIVIASAFQFGVEEREVSSDSELRMWHYKTFYCTFFFLLTSSTSTHSLSTEKSVEMSSTKQKKVDDDIRTQLFN
jgi:hypothetical protein